jgi:CheY-like chemotaxis protein
VNTPAKSLILAVDDNLDQLRLMERFLSSSGFRVIACDSGLKGLDAIREAKPDLILLDVMMPEMDGYEVCSQLQKNSITAYIPVIFITALGEEQDKARAFSVGAVDYLAKPVRKEALLEKVRTHVKTYTRWKELQQGDAASGDGVEPSDFPQFKRFLFDQLDIDPTKKDQFATTPPSHIYSLARHLGISTSQMAKYIADFLKLPYFSQINPYDVKLGVLPMPFCKTNLVVALGNGGEGNTFALSNPFNLEILDNLRKITGRDKALKLAVTEPEHIELLFKSDLGAETPSKYRKQILRNTLLCISPLLWSTRQLLKGPATFTLNRKRMKPSSASGLMGI